MKTNTTDSFDFTIPHIVSVQPRQNWSLHNHEVKDSMRHWTEKGFQSNKQLEKKASTSSTSQLPAVIPAHSPSMISVGIV